MIFIWKKPPARATSKSRGTASGLMERPLAGERAVEDGSTSDLIQLELRSLPHQELEREAG
jgi:hypothetical protein